jgi:hypothetical protein
LSQSQNIFQSVIAPTLQLPFRHYIGFGIGSLIKITKLDLT